MSHPLKVENQRLDSELGDNGLDYMLWVIDDLRRWTSGHGVHGSFHALSQMVTQARLGEHGLSRHRVSFREKFFG